MRYCSKCQMNVENELKRCPLCGEILDLVEIEVVRDYPSRFAKKRRVPIRKLIVFMAMVIISYSFIIGIFHDFNWNWVFIIVCSTLYWSVSVIIGLRVKKNIGPNILTHVFGGTVFAVILDYLLGYQGWSLNFVFPLALMAGTSVFTLLIILRPKRFTDFASYQLLLGGIGLFLLMLVYFELISFPAVAVVAGYYALITCVGMFMFADRKLIHEIKKKFHY